MAPLPFYPARAGGWAGSRLGWPLGRCARWRGGLWADSELGSDSRTVDAHIRRLRKKLSILPDLISTVRGQGYRFNSTPAVRVRVTRPVALAA